MRRFLSRHIVLPAFETLWKRRRTFQYLKNLEQSQWLTKQELDQLQFAALRKLLTHTYQHCPYYREAWTEAGLDPRQLESALDFRKWPLTNRETIRASRRRMRAVVPGMRLISKSTGGSTGEPLHFDLNADSNDRRMAATYRGYEWAGAGPGTRQLHLW